MVDLLTGQIMVHVQQAAEEEHRSLQDLVQILHQHMGVKNVKEKQNAHKNVEKTHVQVNSKYNENVPF